MCVFRPSKHAFRMPCRVQCKTESTSINTNNNNTNNNNNNHTRKWSINFNVCRMYDSLSQLMLAVCSFYVFSFDINWWFMLNDRRATIECYIDFYLKYVSIHRWIGERDRVKGETTNAWERDVLENWIHGYKSVEMNWFGWRCWFFIFVMFFASEPVKFR